MRIANHRYAFPEFSSTLSTLVGGQSAESIIDMHLHAKRADEFGLPPLRLLLFSNRTQLVLIALLRHICWMLMRLNGGMMLAL